MRDAAYRYQYALKKLPAAGRENATDSASLDIYAELQVNLMLNLSRCKRKLNVSGSLSLKTKYYLFFVVLLSLPTPLMRQVVQSPASICLHSIFDTN